MNNAESRAAFKELISKAQVCGLHNHPQINEESRSLIKKADQERRMLNKREIEAICTQSATNPRAIHLAIREASRYVESCKQTLHARQPHLFEEGGALYPTERSDACWRDCWQFFRVVIYAYACGRAAFTDPDGMAALRQLYRRMNVPLLGLNIALEQLETLTVAEIADTDAHAALTATFLHLRAELNKSAVKS